jgi:glycosyltransferase involved in cell wall biosynthesis
VLTVPLAAPDTVPASALPRRPPSVARFVYAGPVSVRKGAHYLLRAWRLVAASTAELHLYGAQTLPAALIAEARAARGGDRIFVHGSVPAATLPDIYQQATALVLPTLCDGFGQVISDALACGLPVITTFNAGGADLVRHEISGFVIPPADADALAGALDWCLSHPDAVLAMREAARQDAAGWTWQDYRRAFVRVLSTAISTGTVAGARPEAPAVLSHA